MSITTRRGDTGETDLLFGIRVSKNDPRLAAVGEIDELNAVLGMARLNVVRAGLREIIVRAQQDLVALMGQVSAGAENAGRYAKGGFAPLDTASLERLTAEAAALEAEFPDGFKSWSVPGAAGDAGSAWLEVARTVCRRAERALAAIGDAGPVMTAWINRLSDLLWLAARCEETVAAVCNRRPEPTS